LVSNKLLKARNSVESGFQRTTSDFFPVNKRQAFDKNLKGNLIRFLPGRSFRRVKSV